MHFAIVSTEGCSLSLWQRLQDEGEEVDVFIQPKQYKKIGDGLVSKVRTYSELVARNGPDTVFIFDGNGMGEAADSLRKRGFLVVGGGALCDRLEKDRTYGEKAAKLLGIKCPTTHEFSSISDTLSFVRKQEGEFFFKSDKYLESSATYGGDTEGLAHYLEYIQKRFGNNIKNILQETVPGVALSTAGWWNGTSFVRPLLGTLEHKKHMAQDIGPATGCALNAVWAYSDEMPKVAKGLKWEELEGLFRSLKAPCGIYDINAVISEKDRQPYFLEWTPRFGYDSEMTSLRGLVIPLGEFFYRLATGKLENAPFEEETYFCATRISVSPYPFEHIEDVEDKHTALGTPLRGMDDSFVPYGVMADAEGELVVGDPGGLIGLIYSAEVGLRDAFGRIAKSIDRLDIPNLQYRPDAVEVLAADVKALEAIGYETI